MLGIPECVEAKPKEVKLNSPLIEKKLSALDFIMSIYPIKADTQITPKNAKLIFNRIIKILNLCIEAIHKFHAGDLKAFDAHVGETACQIRAYHTMLLFGLNNTYGGMVNKIIQLKKFLKDFESSTQICEFRIILESFSGDLLLNKSIVYLSGCYVLNKFADKGSHGFPESINVLSFVEQLNLTPKMSKKIRNHFQKIISRISVEFIFSLARTLNKSRKFMSELEASVIYDENNRKAVPLFTSISLIHDHMLQTHHYIALVIDGGVSSRTFVFEYLQGGYRYSASSGISKSSPCYVIYGITKQKDINEFKYRSQIEYYMKSLSLLEMSAAIHPQLINGKEALIPYEYKIRIKRALFLAKSLGCSLDNAKLFGIHHIYVSRFGNLKY